MFKKIYWLFLILSFLMGQTLIFYDRSYGSIVLIGMVGPAALSYINIEIIQWVSLKKGNLVALWFNVIQFIIKTIYMCFFTLLGVKILGLNFKIFVPILCTTWFFFHILEAFFTDSIIKDSIVKDKD